MLLLILDSLEHLGGNDRGVVSADHISVMAAIIVLYPDILPRIGFEHDSIAMYLTGNTNAPVKDEEFLVHTVVRGDTLWDISAKYLGKGSRYPEIKKLNGLTTNVICSGRKLMIPN